MLTSPQSIPRRAIFLDKDGTLIENVPYNVALEKIRFTKGALAGLRSLYAANYALFVISNQSGVARGYFPEAALVDVELYLRQQFELAGVSLQGFYYCPHHPEGKVLPYSTACDCRKPQPGLLRQAAVEHGISLTDSWMIGDILNDVEAGRAAGCRTILLDNGNETEWQISPQRIPNYTVTDIQEAAQVILKLDATANQIATSTYSTEPIHEF